MKKPVVDLHRCRMCMACVEICPDVFRCVDNVYIDIVEDHNNWSEDLINEAISYCPEDCIHWEEEECEW